MPKAAPLLVLGLGLPERESAEAPATFPALRHPAVPPAEVLIGGRAQLSLLPRHPAEKLLVGNDTEALYARIAANIAAGKRQVALCSGDPLFFGLGARLAAFLAPELFRVVPGIGVLQAAAAFLGVAWEETRAVSLHGRDSLHSLARALIAGGPVLVLADSRTSSQSLAAWMLERGQGAFRLHALEDLYRTPDGEIRAARLSCSPVAELARRREEPAGSPGQRVLYLTPAPDGGTRARTRPWPFGISDDAVAREKGLPTKGPVRAAALAALGIEADHIVWDLGAGSGAVSLEAARLAFRGRVFAVERNADRVDLIRENRRRYGAANLEIIAGAMPGCLRRLSGDGLPKEAFFRAAARQAGGSEREESDLDLLPGPHRIFLGGGLGGDPETAKDILTLAWRALLPGGRLLPDCILLSSLARCRAVLGELGARTDVICLQAGVSVPLAGDIRLRGENPVFLVVAEKRGESQGHSVLDFEGA